MKNEAKAPFGGKNESNRCINILNINIIRRISIAMP